MTATAASIDTFRREVRRGYAMLARVRRDGLGRNGAATVAGIDMRHANAAAILKAACNDPNDPLPEYLDTARGARLLSMYNAIERYAAGLPDVHAHA